MARYDTGEVRRYYDRQSRGFVTLGQGAGEGAIHRAVWGPGVTTRSGAFHYVDDRIADMLQAEHAGSGGGPAVSGQTTSLQHVLDLGCGVGGSLVYLADRLPIRGTGITLSGVQARMAGQRIQARGLADRLSCVEGDFTELPATLGPVDLAYAIESFVHGPSPAAFFAGCRRVLRPTGLLVVCDDFLRPAGGPAAARAVERFRQGWRINSLLDRDELQRLAREEGFRHQATTDLTPWLELGRPRDRVIALLLKLLGWMPLAGTPVAHLVGGDALQTCLTRGWIGYDLACFRRAD